MKRLARSAAALLLAASMAVTMSYPSFAGVWADKWEEIKAAGGSNTELNYKTLTVEQAVSYTLANNQKYKNKYNSRILADMKYYAAVRTVKAKWKDYRTFRYSPLLNLKFPTWPYMDEESELAMKPYLANQDIKKIERELIDLKYDLTNQTRTEFIDLYVNTEKLKFKQDILSLKNETLTRMKAQAAVGNAKADDVTKVQEDITNLESEISKLKRDIASNAKKLGELTGLDLTSGWLYKNPLKTVKIPRDDLESIVKHTLSQDLSVYTAQLESDSAYQQLNVYQQLMQNQYGSKMNYINTFVESAKANRDVDFTAFKSRYEAMLTEIQKPWNAWIPIPIFFFIWIPVPLEYFKGKLSATRYIDNDRYAIYEAADEYIQAYSTLQDTTSSCRSNTESTYETVVTAYNTYQTMTRTTEKLLTDYNKVYGLNKLGKAEYSEVNDSLTSYQESQIDEIDALGEYNKTISEFNRMTYGAIDKYLNDEALSFDEGQEGDSFNLLTELDKPYYYIDMPVEDTAFTFTLYVPDGYEPEITHYEIWYGGIQIGKRTEVGKQIKHLLLTYKDTYELVLRAYSGDDFVGEVSIDATVPRDTVEFASTQEPVVEAKPKVVGSYTTQVNQTLGITTVSFRMEAVETVDSFVITEKDSGSAVLSVDPKKITEGFTYLTFAADLEKLEITFYENGVQSYTAQFDTVNKQIIIPVSGE